MGVKSQGFGFGAEAGKGGGVGKKGEPGVVREENWAQTKKLKVLIGLCVVKRGTGKNTILCQNLEREKGEGIYGLVGRGEKR